MNRIIFGLVFSLLSGSVSHAMFGTTGGRTRSLLLPGCAFVLSEAFRRHISPPGLKVPSNSKRLDWRFFAEEYPCSFDDADEEASAGPADLDDLQDGAGPATDSPPHSER